MADPENNAIRATRPETAPSSRTAIANEITAELLARPWTRPGQVARDAEPHRGPFLLLLATLGLVCGWFSCCLLVPALIGFPLAVTAYALSQHDLQRMRSAVMDRRGYGETDAALDRSIDGVCLNALAFGFIVCFVARFVLLL